MGTDCGAHAARVLVSATRRNPPVIPSEAEESLAILPNVIRDVSTSLDMTKRELLLERAIANQQRLLLDLVFVGRCAL